MSKAFVNPLSDAELETLISVCSEWIPKKYLDMLDRAVTEIQYNREKISTLRSEIEFPRSKDNP